MKKVFYIFFVLLFFIACSDQHKVPKGILKQKEMQAIMWDMVRAGEFLNSFVFNKDTSIDKTTRSLEWFDKIYKIHNVTKEQFEKSYDYYKEHSVLMKDLMDSLGKKYSTPEEQELQPVPPSLTDTGNKQSILPRANRAGMVTDSIDKKRAQKIKR